MLNKVETIDSCEEDVLYLQSEVTYRKKLQDIGNRINAAKNLDEILIDISEEIRTLFEAERITIYAVHGKKRQLVSRFKSGDEIEEIRVPISTSSLAGCSAFKQKLLNIRNVYDKKELASIDPELQFDGSWDRITGFTTRQVLVIPLTFQKFLLGALQLINRKNGTVFTEIDERSVRELAHILGIALYNQKRIARARPSKFDYLLKQNLLTHRELEKAIAATRTQKEPIEEILIRDFKIAKKDVGQSLSEFYKAPFVDYNPDAQIPGELLVGLKIPFLRKNTWVPLGTEDNAVIIAIDNPEDLQRIDVIKTLFSSNQIKFVVALQKDILDYIKLFTHDEKTLAEIDEILSQLQDEAEEIEEAEASVGEEDSAVVQLVNKIILDAYERGASDIHIEPSPGKEPTRVRVRIDGACQVYQTIPYNYRNAVASRIKIMCDLDIAERRKPQDGKIRFKKYGGKDIELRVATMPTQGRMEDIVMRILHTGEPMPLDKIGFSKKNHNRFLGCVIQPYGIIFVCGPTGSGKTTTLHSALSHINKPETKIWTAEDPVEITQKGLRQVQVQPKIGFNFATAMRSFLRADPDVIMVGEMRDKETSQIGIEASLTGHLVLSTLHTNSAAESITRLLDMGMDPFNFADAVLCILAQRLVRTLCVKCKKAYHPSEAEYEELVREYGEDRFKENMNIPNDDNLMLFKPNGCQFCGNTGYRGRMALHELLMGTDEIKRLIQTSARVAEIRDQALKEGMTTLKQDGIEKVFAGHCDLIQIRKVCIR